MVKTRLKEAELQLSTTFPNTEYTCTHVLILGKLNSLS
mgnify:CR=1 FL=1